MLSTILTICLIIALVLVVGFLTKWSFAMLLSPFIVLSKVFSAKSPEEKKKARKLLIAFSLAMVMITLFFIVSSL